MAWLFLAIAGVFEWGWPIGFKLAVSAQGFRFWPGALAAFCMAGSGLFLFLAQREIPMGTAYAVWVGIGATGAFALGVWFFGEALSLARLASVGLIIAGITGLKLATA